MKKILLSAAAIFAFGFVSAQETRFGAKAGLNLANLGGDIEDAEMLLGFHVGGFAEVMISDKFGVQPELLFSMQGAKSESSEDIGGTEFTYESKLKLAYLNIPIMAKYYATEDFNLQFGPQIGFLMSAKDEYEVSGGGDSESESEDVKDAFESIDFGVNFGLGYNFGENFGVEARYNLGLSNIIKDADDFSVNNSVIQVSFGYKF
ncbi:MAG TPA: porin family protein [Flavobacterium sp.]|jgi:hypothetical protein